ncbi:MAG TPA: hypothetical protein VFE25_05390 [Opitutaceae bacterium]|jgi:hypothetical protein|nr:hypothetical protein [Opitutaceae bacterium]
MRSLIDFSPKFLAATTLAIAAASTALANGTVFLEVGPQYGEANPYQYGDGGEFTALTTGLNNTVGLKTGLPAGSQVPDGYASVATYKVGSVVGFETFCIEDQVDFNVGGTYNYSIGLGLQQSTATVKSLSSGAAWLYEEFATGQLAGYDYNTGNDTTDAAKRLADAGLLQATLWALQGEPGDPNIPYNTNPATNFALADILAHFGSFANAQTIADPTNGNDPTYGVVLLELTDGNGNAAQDQLVYWGAPVPDAATTALLVGGALIGMALFARRMKTVAAK